jgi:hypothetical protein
MALIYKALLVLKMDNYQEIHYPRQVMRKGL